MKHPRPCKLQHAAWLLRTLHETAASKERVIAAYPAGFFSPEAPRTLDVGGTVDAWLHKLGEADTDANAGAAGAHATIDDQTTIRTIADSNWIETPRDIDENVFEKTIVAGVSVVVHDNPSPAERKAFLQRARDFALKGCGPPLFASFELASIDSGAAVLVIPAVSFTLAQFGETLERATHDALVSPLVDLDAFRASVYESASAIARHVRTAAVECGVVLLPLPLDAIVFTPRLELVDDAFVAHGFGCHTGNAVVERGVPQLLPCGEAVAVAAGEGDAAFSLAMRTITSCLAHDTPTAAMLVQARLAGRDPLGRRMLALDELPEDHEALRLRPIEPDASGRLARVRSPENLDEVVGVLVQRAGFAVQPREIADASDEYHLRRAIQAAATTGTCAETM